MSSQRRSGAADAVSMAYSSHSAAAPSATAAAIIAAVPPVPRAPPGRLIDAPVSGSVDVITLILAGNSRLVSLVYAAATAAPQIFRTAFRLTLRLSVDGTYAVAGGWR